MDEQKEKPLSVIIDELKSNIVDDISESRLPIAMVGEILLNLTSQIQLQIQKEILEYKG